MDTAELDPTVRSIVGPTIKLRSGAYFDLLNPSGSPIGIMDIAHALSNLCRFVGHTSRFYSVAEHCVHCFDHVEGGADIRREALLHDAAEAFLGDVARPLKSILPDYRRIEREVEAAVREALALPAELSPQVRAIDLGLLLAEKQQLMGGLNEVWPILAGVEAPPVILCCWSPQEAKRQFLARLSRGGVQASRV